MAMHVEPKEKMNDNIKVIVAHSKDLLVTWSPYKKLQMLLVSAASLKCIYV